MSVPAATYSPRSLAALEAHISEEVAKKQSEVFGDQAVIAKEGSALQEGIESFIAQAAAKFPAAPNKSRYINTTCTICPKLYVNFSRLKPIYTQPIENSLFLEEIGKAIQVGILQDLILGSFTQEPLVLNLRNIRILNRPLRQNEHALDQLAQELNGLKIAAVNADITVGEIDRNPSLVKSEIQADIEFGTLINQKAALLQIESTGDETTTEIVIDLPELRAKIEPDGSVTLPNGAKFTVDQFEGDDPVTWVNYSYTLDVPFEV